MSTERPSPGTHRAPRAGGAKRRAVLALLAVAAVVIAGGTTTVILTGGTTTRTSPPATTSTGSPTPSTPSLTTTSGTAAVTTSSSPTATSDPTSTPTKSKTSTSTPVPTPHGVTIKSLQATGRSGQAKATIRYRASVGPSPRIECRVGSTTGAACKGSPWKIGSKAGSRSVKVGGLTDGTRTTLYFFQSSGGVAGPAASGHVAPYGPIGTVRFTKASTNGLTIDFTVRVQPRGKPARVTVTDTAGHSWSAKTGGVTWSGGSSFTETDWNTTYGLTLTVTDASGAGRKSVTVSKSRTTTWTKTYTVADPAHSATCAVPTLDPTWYGKSSCPGTLHNNGTTVQVTCAVTGPAYYKNGKNHGASTTQWTTYFELTDGTYIHAAATQEATADNADGNPTC